MKRYLSIFLTLLLTFSSTYSFAVSSSCFIGVPPTWTKHTPIHYVYSDVFDLLYGNAVHIISVATGATNASGSWFNAAGQGPIFTYVTYPADGAYSWFGTSHVVYTTPEVGIIYTGVSNACSNSGTVQNDNYQVGICTRPIQGLGAPSTILGVSVPTSVQTDINNAITQTILSHQDIKALRTDPHNGNAVVQEITRGFYADDFGLAIYAATLDAMDLLIPNELGWSDGYVAGHVKNASVQIETCSLQPTGFSYFTNMTQYMDAAETPHPYHLFDFNCQTWAASQL